MGSDITLHRLSTILLPVMGWQGGHLHQFYIGSKFYDIPDPEFPSLHESIDERKVKLSEINAVDKKKFIYEYDFGDRWEHTVVLEKILSPTEGRRYPVCIAGKRACPPEDCGGIRGYYQFLEAIQNPEHPEHKSMLEWVGGYFDSDMFDLAEVNETLLHIEEFEDLEDELLQAKFFKAKDR